MEVGFSFIPNNIKNDVRKLEKITISIEKEKSKVMFNEQCVINEILPNYRNNFFGEDQWGNALLHLISGYHTWYSDYKPPKSNNR